MNKVWDYMRHGEAGVGVKNNRNGKEIVKTSKRANTLHFECVCYQNGEYVKHESGKEAILWLMV